MFLLLSLYTIKIASLCARGGDLSLRERYSFRVVLAYASCHILKLFDLRHKLFACTIFRSLSLRFVPGAGIEPTSLARHDFKSCAYTNSATRAIFDLQKLCQKISKSVSFMKFLTNVLLLRIESNDF
jgi:hypothetical protein